MCIKCAPDEFIALRDNKKINVFEAWNITFNELSHIADELAVFLNACTSYYQAILF